MVTGYEILNPLNAFANRFANSCGKDAVKLILEMACLVMQGDMSGFYFAAMGCSSKLQILPLQIVGSEIYHKSSLSISKKLRGEVDFCDIPQSASSNSMASSDGSSQSQQQGIFDDVILLAGRTPNWPRYLYICKVTSGALNNVAVSQLMREMLPAMLSQSLVFGILMNSTQGLVCAMRQDFENRKLNVTYHMFHFISRSSTRFDFESFEAFFMKILRYFNYGMKQIKGIRL